MKNSKFWLIAMAIAIGTITYTAPLKAQVPKVDRSQIDTIQGTYKFKGGDDLDRELHCTDGSLILH